MPEALGSIHRNHGPGGGRAGRGPVLGTDGDVHRRPAGIGDRGTGLKPGNEHPQSLFVGPASTILGLPGAYGGGLCCHMCAVSGAPGGSARRDGGHIRGHQAEGG